MLRENQRILNKSMREADRQRTTLQNQEKKIVIEIKKLAKQNQIDAARMMAKDLVRTRNQIQKFYKMRAQLQATSLRMQTMSSTAAMTDAMKGATRAMMRMNQSMQLPEMQQMMREFERQSEIMDFKEELMNETIDGIGDVDGEEEETQDIIDQVLDEIGISLTSQMSNAPSHSIAQKAQPAKSAVSEGGVKPAGPANPANNAGSDNAGGLGSFDNEEDNDLMARFNNLKK
eukprot:TRINITY_DN2591_c0_g1_i2.p1 TRINITY_DN2591_c0_g1~~TRINITY_DN2591_c0_g1_i2.p1  ORF type:complete len:253 (-),score=100.10 TRINITY_DN2591_c0_g1_i2:85-777(-)